MKNIDIIKGNHYIQDNKELIVGKENTTRKEDNVEKNHD